MNKNNMVMLSSEKHQLPTGPLNLFDSRQATTRALLDKSYNNQKDFYDRAGVKESTTSEYLVSEYAKSGKTIKRYIPKLSNEDVKPTSKETKLIFKDILIKKGYLGNRFSKIGNNFPKGNLLYKYHTFGNVQQEKVVAYLYDCGVFYFVLEQDYIDYIGGNPATLAPATANYHLEVDKVYRYGEIREPNIYIVITKKTDCQYQFRFLKQTTTDRTATMIRHNLSINGVNIAYNYYYGHTLRLRLDINGDWVYNHIKVDCTPVGFNVANERERKINSILS